MTAPLWTAADIAAATGAEVAGTPKPASGVVIDSRAVGPGDLFVALPGDRFDGHDFVSDVLSSGASGAVVSRRPEGLPPTAPLFVVEDTYQALEALGTAARQRASAQVVAVTGSVGKTGTKETLGRALSSFGSTHISQGNLNNHIGAPLSLARLPEDAAFAVMELGMNHAGEIRSLTQMVRPDVAIITTVSPVHAEFFDSVEGIAEAKSEIFEGCEPDAVAVLNRDNDWFDLCAERARDHGISRIVAFGRDPRADVRLVDATVGPGGSRVEVDVAGEPVAFDLRAVGSHWASNAVGVLACIHALGLDPLKASAAFADVVPGKGRGARYRVSLNGGDAFTLIDESYNASPAAMRAAFEVLGLMQPEGHGGRVAVLGDMRELGEDGPALHADLARDLMASDPSRVWTVGPLMNSLRQALPELVRAEHGERSEDIAETIARSVVPGDVILVKGSLGTNMAPIVKALSSLGPATPWDAASSEARGGAANAL